MSSRSSFRLAAALAVATLLGVSGCERDVGTLGPAPYPTDPDVFRDAFGPGVDFQAFGGSKLDALDIDAKVKYRGLRSMKFTVPSVGDPAVPSPGEPSPARAGAT